jgi:Zinc knuckle
MQQPEDTIPGDSNVQEETPGSPCPHTPRTPIEQLREEFDLLRNIKSLVDAAKTNKRSRADIDESSEPESQLAKRQQVRIRPPTESELYVTKDYSHYRAFISTQNSTADANGYGEDQKLAVAIMYLSSTLRELWNVGVESETYTRSWPALQEFLLSQLGDPENRRIEAWGRFLHASPHEGEDDFAYWHRWMQMITEIGPEGGSLEKERLHLFFESFPEYIKREVRKQAVFPKTPQELISMLARLRPSIQAQQRLLRPRESRTRPYNPYRSRGFNPNRTEPPRSQPADIDRTEALKAAAPKQTDQQPESNLREQRVEAGSRYPTNVRCYNCRELGHISKYCPKKTDVSQASI